MKIITRDVSMVSQYKPRIVAILRDIERWISECKVAASGAAGDGSWNTTQQNDGTGTEGDAKEIWALDRLCECLMEKGVLVPLSKKFVILPYHRYREFNENFYLGSDSIPPILSSPASLPLRSGSHFCAMYKASIQTSHMFCVDGLFQSS